MDKIKHKGDDELGKTLMENEHIKVLSDVDFSVSSLHFS